MKKFINQKVVIYIIIGVLVVGCVGIGGWLIANRTGSIEAGLSPIEDDEGNVSDKDWTKRY